MPLFVSFNIVTIPTTASAIYVTMKRIAIVGQITKFSTANLSAIDNNIGVIKDVSIFAATEHRTPDVRCV